MKLMNAVSKGDRIAQLVLEKICQAEIVETDVRSSLHLHLVAELIGRTLMPPPEVLEALGRLVVSERLRRREEAGNKGDWGNKMSCSSGNAYPSLLLKPDSIGVPHARSVVCTTGQSGILYNVCSEEADTIRSLSLLLHRR
jgi:hypothetical protein